MNTILMHGLRDNRTNRSYWITQPQKPKSDYHEFYEASPVMDQLSNIVRSQIKCCAHEKNCDSFIWEVMFLKLCRKFRIKSQSGYFKLYFFAFRE